MERKFQYDMQLKQMEMQAMLTKKNQLSKKIAKIKEAKIQATQQSEMISQRQNDSLPKDFENEPDMGMQAFM